MANRTAGPGTHTAGQTLTATHMNSLPGGWIGLAEITADTSTFTGTLTDIAGLSQAVTVNTSRKIKITFDAWTETSVNDSVVDYFIREGSTTLKVYRSPQYGTGAAQMHLHVSVTLNPSSGAHTYKISGQRVTGTGTQKIVAAASGTSPGPAQLLIEDIGPSS